MQKKTISTPVLQCNELTLQTHQSVYDPAEDSFLLLDSLTVTPADRVFELGTGCGIIALSCARITSQVVCSDINPFAVQLTRRNAVQNRQLLSGSLDVRQGDLFSVLLPHEQFSLVIFNPPYLPTSSHEKVGDWLDVATDGGRDGLRITKRFIRGLKKHLLRTGAAYIVVSSLSPLSILDTLLQTHGFSSEIVARRRFEGEDLLVYRITPAD